jgi:hypothetical protein
MEPRPVLICGYPKSGTTLLLSLLDHHPELLVYPEETKFFNTISGKPARRNADYILAETSASKFLQGEVQVTSGYRDYRQVDAILFRRLLEERLDAPGLAEKDVFEAIILSYGSASEQQDRRYWVEKTPFNELRLDTVYKWWPDVRALYILRDPRDNFTSYARLWEKRKTQLSPIRFMAYWTDSLRAWQCSRVPAASKLLIRYDDLVGEPQRTMQQVVDFLDIEWSDRLVAPTRNGNPWTGNSMYGRDFSGISTDSMGKYKTELPDAQRLFIEAWLSKLMGRFGWDVGGASKAELFGLLRAPEKLLLKMMLVRNLSRLSAYPAFRGVMEKKYA